MRPMHAQNGVPEVAVEQFALDHTLKRLRKLRWIGKESEAEEILAALDGKTRPPARSNKQRRSNYQICRTDLA